VDPDIDMRKPLAELDPETWAPESLDESAWPVARRCAHKPLRRLTPAELRALVQHGLALRHVVPVAVDKLAGDPFLTAQDYPGDLLTAVLEADTRFWVDHEDLWWSVIPILEHAMEIIEERVAREERADYLPWHLGDDFMAALLHFRGIHKVDGES
jgi:hypothetical protein